MATPRTVGRIPIQRLTPALPSWRRLCSSLATSPMVARHSMWILRTSPERMRTWAQVPSRASSVAEAPAERAICAPAPGLSSMQWMVEPTGMLRIGSVLPARIGGSAPFTVGVAHQRDMGRAVRVVLDALDLGRNAVLVALEVHHPVVVLVTTALVAGGDVAVVVATRFLELGLQQRGMGLSLVQVLPRDLHHGAAPGRGGFHLDDSHDLRGLHGEFQFLTGLQRDIGLADIVAAADRLAGALGLALGIEHGNTLDLNLEQQLHSGLDLRLGGVLQHLEPHGIGP